MEVEGNNLPRGNQNILGDWDVVKDGSLRGESAEYVLTHPLSLIKSKAAIRNLANELVQDGVKINWSFRTSVHVHLNCLNLTQPQVCRIIYTYVLMERLLLNFCGESRQNNRFCLRIEDAYGVIPSLQRMFQSGDEWYFPPKDVNRYASVNVDALGKFGSLEFRGMRGCIDDKILSTWVEALVRIRSYAIGSDSVTSIADQFMSMDDVEWVENILGKEISDQITDGLSREQITEALARNYSLSAALLYTF